MLLPSLWPGALGMALMSFTESIAAGRAFARHDDPPPVPNRELIAIGAANLAGSFFRGFPAGGGTSQTAVNSRAGAQTQAAALITVAVVAATLLFLSPLISLAAAGHPCGRRRGDHRSAAESRRFSHHPRGEAHGVSLGSGCLHRRGAARDASGHLGRSGHLGFDARSTRPTIRWSTSSNGNPAPRYSARNPPIIRKTRASRAC